MRLLFSRAAAVAQHAGTSDPGGYHDWADDREAAVRPATAGGRRTGAMTGGRIVPSVLMSVAVALGVVGCPPVPPDGGDAGVGGSATGGAGTGGNAGGAASVPVCSTVASLPTMGTACSTFGESLCDATGNRCVCDRSIWYCTTPCATSYPTEPAPDSACLAGAVCNYPSGASCQCLNSRWQCIGASGCPTAAQMPMTGSACNGLAGLWCDYPNSNPAFHMTCVCSGNAVASTGASWTCIQPRTCPTTQPAYDPNGDCLGVAMCAYGSTYCRCTQSSTPWVCGFGIPWLFPPPSCPGCE